MSNGDVNGVTSPVEETLRLSVNPPGSSAIASDPTVSDPSAATPPLNIPVSDPAASVTNPVQSSDICPKCTLQADMGTSLECFNCKSWLHLSCTGLPSFQIVLFQKTTRRFTCQNCFDSMYAQHKDAQRAVDEEMHRFRSFLDPMYSSQSNGQLHSLDTGEETHTSAGDQNAGEVTLTSEDRRSVQTTGQNSSAPVNRMNTVNISYVQSRTSSDQ